MDKKLHILHHLYADEADPEGLGRLLGEDEALSREHAALADVKGRLDRRPRHRPDAAVVDRVVAAAGRPRQARPDRAPARPGRQRLFGLVGAACTLLVLVVVGVQLFLTSGFPAERAEQEAAQETASLAEADVRDRAEAEAPAPFSDVPKAPEPETAADEAAPTSVPPAEAPRTSERLASASDARALQDPALQDRAWTAPALARGVERAETLAAVQPVQPAPLALAAAEIGWDDADDVRRLHRRIGLVQARSRGLAWDAPLIDASESVLPEPFFSEPLLRESLFDLPAGQPQLLQADQPRLLLQTDRPYAAPRNNR